ncbi:C45 family autoproteolytic acyltransferase/hydolase [Streptomyces triticagri]|uniref:C45 family autoproteolytic acyltransferase/hydolase n=1 Tax=Streptomyces triticagri TaxID=2293568 RepID=UPI0018F400F4|nr:C45 family peptidase [Streptomyces triticagri]
MTSSIERPDHRLHVSVASADAFARGLARGERLREVLPGGIAAYDRLFRLGGIGAAQVREDAAHALDAVDAFRPAARAEIEGIAQGAGTDVLQIAALNARTEILARSSTVPPGECSTLVRRIEEAGAARTFGVQTWDWHVELTPYWHTLESRGAAHDVAGLTEHGILAKIGVNSAGLALHFNILGHRADGVGGVPMHVLAAVVLQEAGSVAEALEIVRAAPVASSGSFALFDAAGGHDGSGVAEAVLLDISPDGVFAVAPEGGALVRTNHFLSPTPAAREKTWLYQPDSGERHELLRWRLAESPAPTAPDDLVAFLRSGAGEAALTCVPDMNLPEGQRWASLATVVLDPRTRTARVLDGTPVEAETRVWRTLRA